MIITVKLSYVNQRRRFKNNRGINDYVEVANGLPIYLFEGQQRARLTVMDPVSIIDENKLTGHRTTTDITVNTTLCSILHNQI